MHSAQLSSGNTFSRRSSRGRIPEKENERGPVCERGLGPMEPQRLGRKMAGVAL